MRLGPKFPQRLPIDAIGTSLRSVFPIVCVVLCVVSGCSKSSTTISTITLSYSQTSITATVGTAIPTDSPVVTGTVTGFSVAPALPAGLTINSSTGAISGTPTAVAAQTNYTVTATNSSSSATTTVQVTVNSNLAPPSNLTYPQTSITATVGTAIQTDTPTVTGTVTNYSVTPTLPTGLSINASSGAISGMPTTVTAQASYTITASNSAGSTSTVVQITVANPAPPSNLTYSQASIVATAGTTIQPDAPTVTGIVLGYTVEPALPFGLNLNSSTGVISGAPSYQMAQSSYTITASNPGGSTTATIQITVNSISPIGLTYPQTTIAATIGTAIQTDTPAVTGTVTGFTVAPALPVGLNLNTSTGAISGTPTSITAQTSYTVTASNSYGSATARLSITVNSPSTIALLSLGLPTGISALQQSANTVLGADGAGDWVLVNSTNGQTLNSGTGALSGTMPCGYETNEIAMAGPIAVVDLGGPLQVMSATTGQVLSTNIGGYWWQIAPDGSYIVTSDGQNLTVWSPEGEQEFTETGNYDAACPVSEVGQVQIAKGPAGANVIQTIIVPSGSISLSPTFSGTFTHWFSDGSHFIASAGASSWVYSSDAASPTVVNATLIGGYGNWGYTSDGNSNISFYSAQSSSGPTTFPVPAEANVDILGRYVAILPHGSSQVSLIDLGASAPSETGYLGGPATSTAFNEFSSSQWVSGDQFGRIFLNGTTQLNVSYGPAVSIAGSQNSLVVSTAVGTMFFFNLNGPTGPTLTSTLNVPATQLAISSDGSVLGAMNAAGEVTFYSLPSMNVVDSFLGEGFELSGSGTTIAAYESSGGSQNSVTVSAITGSPNYLTETYSNPPYGVTATEVVTLSPDGTTLGYESGPLSQFATEIYQNGNPVASVPGQGEGWIDNNQILVADISDSPQLGPSYTGSSIYTSTGTLVANVALPKAIANPQFPSTGTVYNPSTNTILSLTDGSVVWQGPSLSVTGPHGSVAGSYVAYVSGSELYLATY